MKTGHQALGRLAEAKKTTMSKPSRSNSNLDLSQLLDRWKARPEVTIEAVIWNKESLGYRRGVKRLLSMVHRAQEVCSSVEGSKLLPSLLKSPSIPRSISLRWWNLSIRSWACRREAKSPVQSGWDYNSTTGLWSRKTLCTQPKADSVIDWVIAILPKRRK